MYVYLSTPRSTPTKINLFIKVTKHQSTINLIVIHSSYVPKIDKSTSSEMGFREESETDIRKRTSSTLEFKYENKQVPAKFGKIIYSLPQKRYKKKKQVPQKFDVNLTKVTKHQSKNNLFVIHSS